MKVSEEQKEQNNRFISAYMAIIAAVLSGYYLGYTQYIASETRVEFLAALSRVISYISKNGFFFNPIKGGGGILAGIGLGIITYFFLLNDYERHKHYDSATVSGDARWMTQKELEKYNSKYIKPEPEDPIEPSPNIILSQHFSRPLAPVVKGNNNIVCVGGAGEGKSRGLIKPNILQFSASYVITDPSGEIIYDLGEALTKAGYVIKILNLSDLKHSNAYNPLHYVRDDAGVMTVVDCLIKNTKGKNEKNDEFFEKSEKLLYTAIIYYLKDHDPDKSHYNFPTVIKLINMSQVDENNSMAKSKLDLLFEKIPHNSLAYKYYKAFKQAAGKTLKSIIISCIVRLQPFMTPSIIDLTRTDELELEKIGDRKTALFAITPQADESKNFLVSMMYAQLFETLYYIGEERIKQGGSPRLKIPVWCLMDEFANVGEVPRFPSLLSTMRKYGIFALIILQDNNQSESRYKDDWKTLLGNCSTNIYLGSSEYYTQKYYSDLLGTSTVINKNRNVSKGRNESTSAGYQQTSRQLMTTSELNSSMDSNDCIVICRSMHPVYDKKYDYKTHPRYHMTAEGGGKPFKYAEMAAYVTSSEELLDISSLLKARKAANELKNTIASDPESIAVFLKGYDETKDRVKVVLPKKKMSTYDRIVFNLKAKKENDLKNDSLTEKSKIFFEVVPNIPVDTLEQLVDYINTMRPCERYVIFSQKENAKQLTGCAYSADSNETDFINPEVSAIFTEYTQNFNGEKFKNGYMVRFKINASDYDGFVKAVKRNYSKTSAERARERKEQSVDESRRFADD